MGKTFSSEKVFPKVLAFKLYDAAMYIKKLSLKNFRNIEQLEMEPRHGLNIFYGNNAQGKTNLLESIYVGAVGRSHRTYYDRELINFNAQQAHIGLCIQGQTIGETVNIQLKRDGKKVAVNGVSIRKLGELLGILPVVIFSPEDLSLIKGGPGVRRRFMDIEQCQLSAVYYYELQQYHRVLNQRNKLLKNLRYNPADQDTVSVWDSSLAEHGIKIIKHRSDFINKINPIAAQIHSEITQNKETLEIKYKPSVTAEDFAEKLAKNLKKDIQTGSTAYGAHKDDIIFNINGEEARIYGSQGQQRTASLSAKLAEIEIVRTQKNTNPVLLLDDVLSELDFSRQSYLLKSIKDVQTFITCTGVEDIVKNVTKEAEVFEIYKGKVRIVN